MDSAAAVSVNGVSIRLPDERWEHISEGHLDLDGYRNDVLEVVARPDAVYQGRSGSLIAVRNYGRRGKLAVFYREVSSDDGFIITARFLRVLPRTRKVWPLR